MRLKRRLYGIYTVGFLIFMIPCRLAAKVIMQWKLFQMYTHLLYCSVLSLGANVNTKRMSQPDRGSIFHIKKSMKYSGHMQLLCELSKFLKILCFYPPRILNKHWCIYSCLQIPPKENWFQYVRRVYTTAINIPCIAPLIITMNCVHCTIQKDPE